MDTPSLYIAWLIRAQMGLEVTEACDIGRLRIVSLAWMFMHVTRLVTNSAMVTQFSQSMEILAVNGKMLLTGSA